MNFKEMLNEKVEKSEDYSVSTKKLGEMIMKQLSRIEHDVKEQIKYSQGMEDRGGEESKNSYHIWLKNVYNNLNRAY